MDYEAVLMQVLALLQQEQRLSYRVLKRRLHLDDDLLEDLKEDLIYAKKLAVDEDGRVLVWVGEAAGSPRRHRPLLSSPRQRRNGASSRCSSVTWSVRPRSRHSLTPKTCGRWCGPIKTPAPR